MIEAEVDTPVLFILPMGNPAHALHDVLFSIALDNIDKQGETGYCFERLAMAEDKK